MRQRRAQLKSGSGVVFSRVARCGARPHRALRRAAAADGSVQGRAARLQAGVPACRGRRRCVVARKPRCAQLLAAGNGALPQPAFAPTMRAAMKEPDFALRDFFGERRQELISHIPHAVELGMKVEEAGARRALLRIPRGERLLGAASRGVVFGGVITTLLDQVGGTAVMCSQRDLTAIATIDLRIDYMRPSTPGRDLLGYAECYRLTRNVAFVKSRAFHDGEFDDPFAISLSTYMLASSAAAPGVVKALEAGRSGKWRADKPQ